MNSWSFAYNFLYFLRVIMVSIYDNGEGTPRPHNIQMSQTPPGLPGSVICTVLVTFPWARRPSNEDAKTWKIEPAYLLYQIENITSYQ